MLGFYLIITTIASSECNQYCTIMSTDNCVKSWLKDLTPSKLTYQLNVFDSPLQWSAMHAQINDSCIDENVRRAFNGSIHTLFPVIRFSAYAERDSF